VVLETIITQIIIFAHEWVHLHKMNLIDLIAKFTDSSIK